MRFLKRLALPILVGLLVGLSMAALDLTVFRHILPADLFRIASEQTYWQRLVKFMPLAVLDELIFRLVLVSALVWILRKFSPADIAWKVAIVGVALAYIPLFHPAYAQSLELSPLVFTRELVEHAGAGIAWGALFWKRGLFASIAGHVSAHLPLQLGWCLLAL